MNEGLRGVQALAVSVAAHRGRLPMTTRFIRSTCAGWIHRLDIVLRALMV